MPNGICIIGIEAEEPKKILVERVVFDSVIAMTALQTCDVTQNFQFHDLIKIPRIHNYNMRKKNKN